MLLQWRPYSVFSGKVERGNSMIDFSERDKLNPFTWYERMRRENPVLVDEDGDVHAFGYEAVKKVLFEHELFSSRRGPADDPNNPIAASLISLDPPRHRQLRSLVSQAFTPRAIAALAPRIEEISSGLIQDMKAASGEVDFVETFSVPLPVTVIAELLGIPLEDRDKFKVWSDAIISGTAEMDSGGELNFTDAQREMVMYFGEMIAERTRRPKEDFVSQLLAATVDGERLSPTDILGFCILLLVAGNETTTNLLSNAILTLNEHQEFWSSMRDSAAMVENVVEEVLRYRSPVQHMYRTATRDLELGGVQIPANAAVVAWMGSANRDEAAFEHAEQFVPGRSPNRHVAFGHGIHFCLGAPLARLEAKISLTQLAREFRRIDVDTSRLVSIPTSFVYGFYHMPVTLA